MGKGRVVEEREREVVERVAWGKGEVVGMERAAGEGRRAGGVRRMVGGGARRAGVGGAGTAAGWWCSPRETWYTWGVEGAGRHVQVGGQRSTVRPPDGLGMGSKCTYVV